MVTGLLQSIHSLHGTHGTHQAKVNYNRGPLPTGKAAPARVRLMVEIRVEVRVITGPLSVGKAIAVSVLDLEACNLRFRLPNRVIRVIRVIFVIRVIRTFQECNPCNPCNPCVTSRTVIRECNMCNPCNPCNPCVTSRSVIRVIRVIRVLL